LENRDEHLNGDQFETEEQKRL